jgi:hypothetical protein
MASWIIELELSVSRICWILLEIVFPGCISKKKRIVCENMVRIQQKVRVGPTTPLTLVGVGTRQHGTAEEREREKDEFVTTHGRGPALLLRNRVRRRRLNTKAEASRSNQIPSRCCYSDHKRATGR